jgi:hypothetical protein
MRLLEQFRVVTRDGQQHTVACYHDSCEQRIDAGCMERVDTIRRYQLNGREDIQRIDDRTFLTAEGVVLRRAVR